MTISRWRGRSRLMFLRLCVRAPRMRMYSIPCLGCLWGQANLLIYSFSLALSKHFLHRIMAAVGTEPRDSATIEARSERPLREENLHGIREQGDSGRQPRPGPGDPLHDRR